MWWPIGAFLSGLIGAACGLIAVLRLTAWHNNLPKSGGTPDGIAAGVLMLEALALYAVCALIASTVSATIFIPSDWRLGSAILAVLLHALVLPFILVV